MMFRLGPLWVKIRHSVTSPSCFSDLLRTARVTIARLWSSAHCSCVTVLLLRARICCRQEREETSMPSKRLKVAIVGGGIGGLSAANAVLRRGIDVTVWEQADPLGESGTGLSFFPMVCDSLNE
jgi:NADPH-dependent 2,4-dienoyl-CoA reductase/sulfur reductase-like enzyme